MTTEPTVASELRGVEKARAFRDDVLVGPEALERLAASAQERSSPLGAASRVARAAPRVVLVGLGSSLSAARSCAGRLRASGVDAVAEAASLANGAPPREGTLCVVISASGATPEVVEAAERHRGVSHLIALTNREDSDLARTAPHCVPLLSGDERGGVACRTFQATQAALLLLFGHALPADVRRAAASARALIESRAGWLVSAVDALEGAACVDVIGPEERRASFEQGALMLREGPRMVAGGYDAGDWLHVGVYLTVHAGWRGVILGGSRYDGEAMDWVRRRRARVVAIGPEVDGAAAHIPIDSRDAALVEVVAVELLAAELWERAEARRP